MTRACQSLVAILVVGTMQVAPAAEPLPRVFFSPADRTAIIALRRQSAAGITATAPTSPTASGSATAEVKAPPPAALRLDGISIAPDGQTFAWVSGHRYRNGSMLGSARLLISRDGVRLTGTGNRDRLIRVGETLARVP
jgi:hypothetical protein